MTRLAQPTRRTRTERWLGWLLRGYRWRDDLLGDLTELRHRRQYALEVFLLSLRYLAPAVWHRLSARSPRAHPPTQPTRQEFRMHFLWTDLRLSLRGLRRRPGASLLIVSTLAIGLAANVAVWCLIDVLILHPYAFDAPDRLVLINDVLDGEEPNPTRVSPAILLDLRTANRGANKPVEAVVGWDTWGANRLAGTAPERLLAARVSGEFFDILRVRPEHGRFFAESDTASNSEKPIVLSYALWQRSFEGDPSVLGRSVTLDEIAYTVVGIGPRALAFPYGTEAWVPLEFTPSEAAVRDSRYLGVFARLSPGVDLDEARTQFATLASRLAKDHPQTQTGRRLSVETLERGLRDRGAMPILVAFQTAALFILLIGWVNVAHLVFARAQERRPQLAVLHALGAGRARIVSLLLTEGLVFGVAAGLASLPLAVLATAWLREVMPESIRRFVPGWERLGIDPRSLVALAILVTASVLAVSLLPALSAARGRDSELLRGTGRSSTGGRAKQRGHNALVVGELVAGLVLVVSAGVAVRGADRMLHGPQGYQPDGLVSFQMNLAEDRYKDPRRRAEFVRESVTRLTALAGVEHAAVTNVLPGQGNNHSLAIAREGDPELEPGRVAPLADFRAVSADYFAALGLPIVDGRALRDDDDANAPAVAVISQSMAKRYWPSRPALGQRFRAGGADTPWVTVVGISGDHIHHWFDRRSYPTFFVPFEQRPRLWLGFLLRSNPHSPPAAELERAARTAVATVDPGQAPFSFMSQRQAMREGNIGLEVVSGVMSALAGLGLALAVSGFYGVMSHRVAARTRDISVRVALGATAGEVLRTLMGQVLRLTAIGLALGLPLAALAARGLGSVLRGVASFDLWLALGAAALMASAAILAALLPARRVLRLDPAAVLRAE